MLNMSSPNTGADAALGYSHRVANEIFRSQEIKGFPYFRLNLVDGGNDLREVPPARSPRPAVPDVLVHTTHVTLYWGEAGHPVTSSTCETLTGIGGEGLDGMQVGRIILARVLARWRLRVCRIGIRQRSGNLVNLLGRIKKGFGR